MPTKQHAFILAKGGGGAQRDRGACHSLGRPMPPMVTVLICEYSAITA
jgi:hypothetical protein